MSGQTGKLQSNQIASIQQVEESRSTPESSPVEAESTDTVNTEPQSEEVVQSSPENEPPIVNQNGFSFANPAASRYLYAPSSIGLQAGQGYVSQKLLFTSGVYALTDNATILVGTLVPFPLVSVLGGKVSKTLNPDLHVMESKAFSYHSQD